MNIFWFRRDLRIADNPTFTAAVKDDSVLPIYILDNRDEYAIGGASKWWLHHSLYILNEALEGNLHFFYGNPEILIPELAKKLKVKKVFWNKCYEPAFFKTDASIERSLQDMSITVSSKNGCLLWEPQELLKKDGAPYKVFTPFLKLCLNKEPSLKTLQKPRNIRFAKQKPVGSVVLDKLQLLPKIKWDTGIQKLWKPGEEEARKVLRTFVSLKLHRYENNRNLPAQDVLSRLSPHLHFGEISPIAIWNAVRRDTPENKNNEKFISELCWREFACHLLHHFPSTASESYNKQLSRLQWKYDKQLLIKWQKGQTGYPIIDAGMRELWHTGYMHNRVRMLTASFLIKNLLTDWRIGADWFMDCLVDADLSVNTMNWQWVASTGLDAAPFFRVFNPILQSKKYDRDGTYIKKWVPELKQLSSKYIHQPWLATEKVLQTAAVNLGENYPLPCVDLTYSIKEALLAYKRTKQ